MLNRNIIIEFIKEHFAETDFKILENEIQLNSPFKLDKKFHLGISLSPETLGLWNDFKPPQDSGDFFSFVAKFLNMEKEEAKFFLINKYHHLLTIDNSINFNIYPQKNKKELITNLTEDFFPSISMPTYCEPLFKEDGSYPSLAKQHIVFLQNKNISLENIKKAKIYFGYYGVWNNCLVIPFYKKDNKNIFYYVGRNIKEKKYQNVTGNIIKGKSSGVCYNVFSTSPIVFLTEGIFDALAIGESGIALLGNKITELQIELILKTAPREKIVFVGDNFRLDDASKNSLLTNLQIIYEKINNLSPQTKLEVFLWDNHYSQFKDFSRCPFPINPEDVLTHCKPYTLDSDFEFNLIIKL